MELLLLAAPLVAALMIEALRRRADIRAYPPPGRIIEVDGQRLHLRSLGDGGPTVVLVSGGGTAAALSYPLQDHIAAFTRACSYDRPGLGWSDPAVSGRGFDAAARQIYALLKAGGEPGPYVLVGESLGGLIARAFAAAFPEETAGLVLVDSAEEQHVFANLDRMKTQTRGLALYGVLARLGVVRWLVVHRPAGLGLPHDLPLAERRRLAALVGRASYLIAAQQEIEAYELTPPRRRAAGGFGRLGDMPLAVIRHGRPFTGQNAHMEDGWTQAQERLAALSTDSILIVAEDSGHAIAQTCPELVAEAIKRIVLKVRHP